MYDPEAYGVDEWGVADESALGAAAGKPKKARKPRNKAGPKRAAPKKGPKQLVQMIQPPTNPQPATKSKKAPLTAPSNSSALFNALLPGNAYFLVSEVFLLSHSTLSLMHLLESKDCRHLKKIRSHFTYKSKLFCRLYVGELSNLTP